MYFKQNRAIYPSNEKPLKLENVFIYLGSCISSTESDISMHKRKAYAAIEKLTIIWKSDLFDKIKEDSFQDLAASVLLYGCNI